MAKKKIKLKALKKVQIASPPKAAIADTVSGYRLKISRLTIDKLGVKLYDKASAVVAELVANSYDADATKVTVSLPLGRLISSRPDYFIEVNDNGHGMTPSEAQDHFLRVGRDRRIAMRDGGRSKEKKRPVMGRKGIGKLAPFGICKRMEVWSAGGEKTAEGYLVSHFFLDYDELVKDEETEVPLSKGSDDRTYSKIRGTKIRLTSFLPKRVPVSETFYRQLATRFAFSKSDFQIGVVDTSETDGSAKESRTPHIISQEEVDIHEETKIDAEQEPLETEDGTTLPVTGWLAMAKKSYKTEELAGVRIYARGKIVATTRDFEQPAGFTGEFTIRSYLVGELHAEWLDEDKGEDLIRSDRQGILWDSDYGRSLRNWGAKIIRKIGVLSKKKRREKVTETFLTRSRIEERAKKAFRDEDVAKTAVEIAKQIGGLAAEDELEDEEYIESLSSFILNVAPHKALIQAFQDFAAESSGDSSGQPTLNELIDLFGKARVAELASYSQIASERVLAIKKLSSILENGTAEEAELQQLITQAPWLIEPTWQTISANQTLKTFKSSFENEYNRDRKKEDQVKLAIDYETKRPDFTLMNFGNRLQIVEIKRPNYKFSDEDAARLLNYFEAFDKFFDEHDVISNQIPNGYEVILVCDGEDVKKPANKIALAGVKREKKLRRITWSDFLANATKSHEQFLQVHDNFEKKKKAKGN